MNIKKIIKHLESLDANDDSDIEYMVNALRDAVIMICRLKMTENHKCVEHRAYLDACDDCKAKGEAKNCDLVVYGICSICGEIVK